MFWGQGDSSRLDEDTGKTLSHLRRLNETGHVVGLNAEKTKTALNAVDFYGQWESVFKLLSSLKNVGILVGVLLGLYWATQGAIVSWITGLGAGL